MAAGASWLSLASFSSSSPWQVILEIAPDVAKKQMGGLDGIALFSIVGALVVITVPHFAHSALHQPIPIAF